MNEFVKIEFHAHWLEIKLCRPELHNAFNVEFINQIKSAFHAIKSEHRFVVLSSEGKSFCAGADLNWMKSMASYTEDQNFQDSKGLAGLFETINHCSVPVIGIVQGAAYGGGVGLVSCCDYVLASENAKFALTEVKLGLIPAVISPFVMAKIGESWSRALFTSAEAIDANKAMMIGLVHQVCKVDELAAKKNELITSYLLNGPVAIKEAKDLVRVIKTGHNVAHETCTRIARLRVSKEGQDGMNALLNKQNPSWRTE